MNFTTCCDYPVLDKIDKEIKVGNIMDKEEVIRQNPNFVFYDDEVLSDSKIQNRDYYHEWVNTGYIMKAISVRNATILVLDLK